MGLVFIAHSMNSSMNLNFISESDRNYELYIYFVSFLLSFVLGLCRCWDSQTKLREHSADALAASAGM